MLMAIFAVVNTLATQEAPKAPNCNAATTVAIEACLQDELVRAENDLQRYASAATTHAKKEEAATSDGDAPDVAIRKAETIWRTYRDTECGAVYSLWSGGTIRGIMEQTCSIRLTRLHTHTLWLEWLTYPDNTPPILPEPPVAAAP